MGVEPWDAVFDILLKERSPTSVAMASAGYAMDSGRRVMKHPTASIISDGLALSPTGPLANVRFQVLQSYGYIPLLFERFVKKERLMTLENAVSKCTCLPARRLGLKDRGVIEIGCAADITIFDPEEIECVATFDEPRAFPVGIEFVIVNGEVVVDNGRQTTRLPGRPILHS
jgi:N-acyl-D-aspartate/D-glutamate deacylase